MTIRLDMRKAVSRASEALGESVDAVRSFLSSHLDDDGGFRGRDGRSDLYYTVFGLEAAMALNANIPYERVSSYLDGFEAGRSLDLVHLGADIRVPFGEPNDLLHLRRFGKNVGLHHDNHGLLRDSGVRAAAPTTPQCPKSTVAV